MSRLNLSSKSANEMPQQWQAARQQPNTAQSNVSKASMQEMDSLLAAEKVCLIIWHTFSPRLCMQGCIALQPSSLSIDHLFLAVFGFLCCIHCPCTARLKAVPVLGCWHALDCTQRVLLNTTY